MSMHTHLPPDLLWDGGRRIPDTASARLCKMGPKKQRNNVSGTSHGSDPQEEYAILVLDRHAISICIAASYLPLRHSRPILSASSPYEKDRPDTRLPHHNHIPVAVSILHSHALILTTNTCRFENLKICIRKLRRSTCDLQYHQLHARTIARSQPKCYHICGFC